MFSEDEEKFESNESEKRLFTINGISILTNLENWPMDSMPLLMYEGDRNASEYVITNPKITEKSIGLIRFVVLREIEGPVLNISDIDWNNIDLIIKYLGIGVGVDFLYPLFLTPDDRVIWYDECGARKSHTCQYRPEDDGELLDMNLNDVNRTDSPYVTLNKLNLYPNKLEMISETEEKMTGENRHFNNVIDEIIQTLSVVPNLLVVKDVALARFRGIKNLIKRSRYKFADTLVHVHTVDVFAYGPDSRESIIEAVRLCIELSKKTFRKSGGEVTFINTKEMLTPFRTQHKIIVPIMNKCTSVIDLNIVFPLVRLHSKRDILTKIPLDCFAIGFEPKEPNIFYGLPRTYRSLDTMTNVVDPTRNGTKYLWTLLGLSDIGFDIAIPGFDIDDLFKKPDDICSVKILKKPDDICSVKILKILNLAYTGGEKRKRTFRTRETARSRTTRRENNAYRRIIERILRNMRLSGLVHLLTQIIDKRLISYHSNRYSNSEIAMEQDHKYTMYLLSSSFTRQLDRTEVIFGDVLNQGEREFKIYITSKNEDITYTPLFPKIELLNFETETVLYQVKTAFYGQYTCVENVDLPADSDKQSNYSNLHELLDAVSQRTRKEWYSKCSNQGDPILLEKFADLEEKDVVKIFLGDNRTGECYITDQLLRFWNNPEIVMRNWKRTNPNVPIDISGFGGKPGIQKYYKLPLTGTWITKSAVNQIRQKLRVLRLKVKRRNQLIGNRYGSFGSREIHGQSPGETIWQEI